MISELSFNEEGFASIPVKKSNRLIEKNIYERNRIYVVEENGKTFIHFLNSKTEHLQKKQISNDLVKISMQDGAGILSSETQETIRNFVADNKGSIQRFYREGNRILYVAGFIFKAIKEAEFNGKDLSEVAFSMQSIDGKKVEYDRSTCKDSIYLYGLKKLREFDSETHCCTPLEFKRLSEMKLPKEKIAEFQKLIKNE